MRRFAWLLPSLAIVALAACGGDGIGPPRVEPPAAPAANDPAFTVGGVTRWNLIGNPLTPGQDTLAIDIAAPQGTEVVDAWVAGGPGQRLTAGADGHFTGDLDIGALGPGEHELLFAADGDRTAFARATFLRTHPLYFLMSTDWDFPDPGANALDVHDRLRADHPNVRYTMFVGPYTFTDPDITEARRAEIVTWLTDHRDQQHDELGLHIHPWCNFVVAAGLTCITDQSTVYQTDTTGYTIKLEAYGEAGLETLLDKAREIFDERGLGKPITFRAGGWTASIDNLKALAAKEFVADTSALNWPYIEEWTRPSVTELWTWNMTNWSQINDTSQPYYPNVVDKQSGAAPNLPILEVPDNGVMVDYVTVDEMKSILAANWDGATPLAKPTTFMMGFHPSQQFSLDEEHRLDGILDHADQFQAANHAGPIVYEVLKDLPAVWPQP
ncbi:MAG TPA: hypothetical protein VHE35_33695 [Kofleriaceae bacterium]|nr:hypothetical protein [Kofleriaceae bacterium]